MTTIKIRYHFLNHVFIEFTKIILLMTSLMVGHKASGSSTHLCGILYNVSGKNQIESMTIKLTTNYPLPRDPFGLQMFDIDDEHFIGEFQSQLNIDWRNLLLDNNFTRIKKIQNENISLCLERFESINVRSSTSLFLVVKKAHEYKVWQNGEVMISD